MSIFSSLARMFGILAGQKRCWFCDARDYTDHLDGDVCRSIPCKRQTPLAERWEKVGHQRELGWTTPTDEDAARWDARMEEIDRKRRIREDEGVK